MGKELCLANFFKAFVKKSENIKDIRFQQYQKESKVLSFKIHLIGKYSIAFKGSNKYFKSLECHLRI